jgi:DNA-binding NarL/FixJ family response regulator
MSKSRSGYRTAPNLPPLITQDIQRAIAIVIQVRQALTTQTERLDQLEGELRLLVDGPLPLIEPLTPREIEVLHYAAIGETTKEIAARMGVAEGTLMSSLSRIYRKLQVRNRNEAAFKAWKLGII